MILIFFLTLMFLFILFDKQKYYFAYTQNSNPLFTGKSLRFILSDIKASIKLNWIQALAGLAGKAGGGKGIMGMLGKGGGGGKSGGGGMMSSAMNGATKPLKASMSLATGLVQGIQAAKLKKKAEAAFPELVDPTQASFLAELNQKRKSIDTGADFASGMQQIDTSNAATNNALVQAGGGDTGATMQGLIQAQAGAGAAKNAVLAQGQQQQYAYTRSAQDMLDQISARKMQLQLLRSQQARAEWDRKAKLSSANLQAGAAGLMPGGNKQARPDAQFGGGPGEAQQAPITTGPAQSSIFGSPAPPPNPNPVPATSIETTGATAPTVTPAVTETAKGLGPVMNLVKR